MDIGLPAPSPSGVNFMPSSPPPDASTNANCWPDPKDGPSPQCGDLNYQFMEMVTKKRGNCLLTPLKRSDYRHYLNNRKSTNYHGSLAERRRQAHDKHWALSFFELQDNQVYRRAEQRKDGSWFQPRYAACTYDAMEIIQKSHCNLYHASE